MTILNMTYGQGNPYQPFHLNWISDLAIVWWNTQATITWTDPWNLVVDGQTLATWSSTKLVRKVGSAPSDSSDGTLVLTETVADTYSVNGYVDTGLTNGTTYYYWAFATSTQWLETISNIESVNPQAPLIPTNWLLAYYPMNTDWNDHKSELWVTGTTYNCSMRNSFWYEFTTGKVWNCLHRTNAWDASLNTWITLGSEYTIMMWIKQPISNSWKFHRSTKTTDSWAWENSQWEYNWWQGDPYIEIWIKSWTSHIYYSQPYTTENFVHYCVTKNWSTIKIYINGVWETFTWDSSSWENTLKLMWIFDAWSIFYADEVCIYNRVLTDQEILDYYTATA